MTEVDKKHDGDGISRRTAMLAGAAALGVAGAGLAGARGAAAQTPDMERTVTVRFASTVNNSAPWEFRPNDPTMEVHPGVLYRTTYRAENRLGVKRVAQAVPSVAPNPAPDATPTM